MSSHWWEDSPVLGLDLEATGTNPETARIVSAALIGLGASGKLRSRVELLADPGIPIPAEATAVHGITDAQAADGDDPIDVLTILLTEITAFLRNGVPLVVFNAPYDLTLLDRELRRHHLPALGDFGYHSPPVILDPLILDWKADRSRSGSRKLTDQCIHYDVPLARAHNAAADAMAAALLARVLPRVHPVLRRDLVSLHHDQVVWARQRAESLQKYLRDKHDDPEITCPRQWPMISAPEEIPA